MHRKKFDNLRHRIVGICGEYAPELVQETNEALKKVSIRIPLKQKLSGFDKKLKKGLQFNPKKYERDN